MMKNTALIFCLMLFIGCASAHSGHYAVQIDDHGAQTGKSKTTALGLIVSGKENISLASLYFGVIDFTFENTSQEWIRIKDIKIDFGDDKVNQNIILTSGSDINIWYESIKKRNIIRDFNTEVILGAIAGFSAGMALSSNNQSMQKAGTITAIGAASSLSAYEFNKALDKIEKAEIFPENHLLSKGFIIPPGLFVKKWLLINSQNHKDIGYIKSIFLEYETENSKKEKIKLDFRLFDPSSGWQRDIR